MAVSYDTIVIGSGCGGSAAAALMSHLGHRTLLIEKNRIIGGRAAVFEKDGFKLDHGHILTRCDKGPHGEVLRRVHCEDLMPKYSYVKDWPILAKLDDRTVDVSPSVKKFFYQGKLFQVGKSIDLKLREILALGRMLSRQAFMSEQEIGRYDNMDMKAFMSKYKNNPYLYLCLEGFTVGIFGATIREASAGEMIRIFRAVLRELGAAGYPVSGAGVGIVPQSFIKAAQRYGTEIMTGTTVDSIVIENGEAKGVMVNGAKILADRVISNAGIMPTVTKLVGSEHFDNRYVNRVSSLKYSCSGLSFKFALKKKITNYVWGWEIPRDAQKSYDDMMAGRKPERFIIMYFSPSNLDPSLAPEGCQTISCIAGGPLREPGTFDWKPYMQALRRQIEEMLPGISDNTIFCREDSPDQIAAFNGRFYGDAVGAAQTVDQMGDLRPSMISPVKNLYYTGADVGWGSMATEAATLSALYLHDHMRHGA